MHLACIGHALLNDAIYSIYWLIIIINSHKFQPLRFHDFAYEFSYGLFVVCINL